VNLFTKLAGTPINVNAINVGTGSQDATGLASLGLTFTFHASYQSLQSFIAALDRLTATDGTNIKVQGRLVTIDSVTMSPYNNGSTTATVTATVYSQNPASLGPSTGASGSTGVTGATGATSTASTASVSG
jgi:hypothetical protein